jgi:hypothetical protein
MVRPSRRAFERVLVIVFENQYRSYVMANPYFRGLARQGIELANAYGVMHPSQTNYIAALAGEICNVSDDAVPDPLLTQRTIVDLIEEAPGQLDWRAYMQSYVAEADPWTPTVVPGTFANPAYTRKHNAFFSFERIVRRQSRWERVVDEAQFYADILNGTLPEFAWFSPNQWNDGHFIDGTEDEPHERAPQLVDQGARWLERFFGRLRFPGPDAHVPPGTLVVVTYDEADFEADYNAHDATCYDGPNQVYCVLLGDMITPGIEREGYNHYSLLRTVEQNFGLGSLGKNDEHANWYQFLWKRHFAWSAPMATPIETSGPAASAGLDRTLHVVTTDDVGSLSMATFDGHRWSSGVALGVRSTGGPALAACTEVLVLCYPDSDRNLAVQYWTRDKGWTRPEVLEAGPVDDVALTSRGGDDMVVLAWSDPDGRLHSRYFAEDTWHDPVDVGQDGRGQMALGAIGPSVFLLQQHEDRAHLDAVTYNTAPWNVVMVPPTEDGGPNDDTTIHAWSPTAVAVTHYRAAHSEITPGEPEPVADRLKGAPPMAMATLDGVLHLVHARPTSRTMVTETFSVAGILTPKRPVSYRVADVKTASNGYGTLTEASWTRQHPMGDVRLGEGRALCMARRHDEIVLLWQAEDHPHLLMSQGAYRDDQS